MFKKFFNIFKGMSEQDRMIHFLSQAQDRVQLECLMKQWDERQRQERCNARRMF